MKDIEWLNSQLDVMDIGWECSHPDYHEAIRKFRKLINQLDEPEVLSQEENINIVLDDLKEHIKEQQSLSQNVGMAHTPAGNDTYYRQYDYVLECINEYEPSEDLQNLLVPKQKLPVIPQFVADWIEDNRDETLWTALVGAEATNKYSDVYKYLWNEHGDRKGKHDLVVRAWLDGYTVEEEQKYYIQITKYDFMVMDDDGFMYPENLNPHDYKNTFTEQEIKDYDPKYWAFRKPAEEVEE